MEDDFLWCPVCMEEYEDPRALPCLHTFCYKCLVQLAVNYVLDNSSPQGSTSRIARYLAEKSSAGGSGQLKLSEQDTNQLDSFLKESSAPKELKCPLCTEKHSIPSNEGVASFRKDFRINKLIHQYNYAHRTALHIKECPYRENENRESEAYEKCCTDDHDKHNVILLSKRADSAKDILKQQVTINMTQNLSRIKALVLADEHVTNSFVMAENEVNQRFQEVQEKLKEAIDTCLQELNKHKKGQQTEISRKMDVLCRKQEIFEGVKEILDISKVKQTINTFQYNERLVTEMKKLNRDLDEWSFMYKIPKLSDYTFDFELCRAVQIIYEAVCLDKRQIENMEKHNHKIKEPKESIAVRHHQSENRRQIQNEDSRETEAIVNRNAASTLENLVSIAAEVENMDIESHGQGRGEFILKLETSIETSGLIESFAVSPDEKIYITTNSHLLCYRRDLSEKVFEKPRIAGADASAVVVSRHDKIPFLAQLDIKRKVLNIISLETISLMHARPIRKDLMTFLASSGHYLAYAFREVGRVNIQVLLIENKTAPVISQPYWHIQIPLPMRAMSLSISTGGCPVVVCSHRFKVQNAASKHGYALASVILGEKDVLSTTYTFAELDSSVSDYDLKCLYCVGI